LNDEISFYDTLWRIVVGQRLGTDYHDPLGFGPYQLAALLWRWLGPHAYVMRLSIALFSISIAVVGYLVARRVATRRIDLALLFCITLAFQLSTPTVYPDSAQFGLMEFYNRLSASALTVLFLHTFGERGSADNAEPGREIVIAIALNTFLLEVLFLTKISGLLLGLFIMCLGCCSVQTRIGKKLVVFCGSIAAFTAATAFEFAALGFDPILVIREYALAAQAKSDSLSRELVQALLNWRFVASLALVFVFGLLQRPSGSQGAAWLRTRIVIVGCYALCQLALNMTNAGPPTMWLAPAAIVSLATWVDSKGIEWRTWPLRKSWPRFDPYLLGEASLRELAPFLVFVLVLFRQVLGSVLGAGFAASTALGITAPYVIAAGRGVSLQVYPEGLYEKSLNDAVNLIASLKLDHHKIANLDYANPFPALLLAPPPKGNYAWFAWGYDIPGGLVLNTSDVIGDACVVMIPGLEPFNPEVTRRLLDVVQSELLTEFQMLYQDAWWSIFRRSHDCTVASRPNEALAPLRSSASGG
jgi:hypothetical protein